MSSTGSEVFPDHYGGHAVATTKHRVHTTCTPKLRINFCEPTVPADYHHMDRRRPLSAQRWSLTTMADMQWPRQHIPCKQHAPQSSRRTAPTAVTTWTIDVLYWLRGSPRPLWWTWPRILCMQRGPQSPRRTAVSHLSQLKITIWTASILCQFKVHP